MPVCHVCREWLQFDPARPHAIHICRGQPLPRLGAYALPPQAVQPPQPAPIPQAPAPPPMPARVAGGGGGGGGGAGGLQAGLQGAQVFRRHNLGNGLQPTGGPGPVTPLQFEALIQPDGSIQEAALMALIPTNAPNRWTTGDMDRILTGGKWHVPKHNGGVFEVHLHAPDANAGLGANARNGPIVRICGSGNNYLLSQVWQNQADARQPPTRWSKNVQTLNLSHIRLRGPISDSGNW